MTDCRRRVSAQSGLLRAKRRRPVLLDSFTQLLRRRTQAQPLVGVAKQRAGFPILTTRAVGSSGTVATTWDGESLREDARQIERWKGCPAAMWRQVQLNCEPGDIWCRRRQRQALLHWAYDSRKFCLILSPSERYQPFQTLSGDEWMRELECATAVFEKAIAKEEKSRGTRWIRWVRAGRAVDQGAARAQGAHRQGDRRALQQGSDRVARQDARAR